MRAHGDNTTRRQIGCGQELQHASEHLIRATPAGEGYNEIRVDSQERNFEGNQCISPAWLEPHVSVDSAILLQMGQHHTEEEASHRICPLVNQARVIRKCGGGRRGGRRSGVEVTQEALMASPYLEMTKYSAYQM